MSGYVEWYGKGGRSQVWQTPPDFFDKLHARFNFTMDGAASHHSALLPKYSTERRPLPWAGERVFCNPPWSNVRFFLDQSREAELAVFLVPSRTNARWFHHALAMGYRAEFFPGRLKFYKGRAPPKKGRGSSPVDCLLLVKDAKAK